MRKVILLFTLFFGLISLYGCGATKAIRAGIEYKDLKINTISEDSLTIEAMPGERIALVVRDKTDKNIADAVKAETIAELNKAGYEIVNDFKNADYIVRLDISDKFDEKSARETIAGDDNGGTAVGAGAGFLAGARSGKIGTALVGAAVGATVGLVSDLTSSMVKIGTMEFYCSVLVKKKVDGVVTTTLETNIGKGDATKTSQEYEIQDHYLKFHEKFVVQAKKVDLDWDECDKQVIAEISKHVASIF